VTGGTFISSWTADPGWGDWQCRAPLRATPQTLLPAASSDHRWPSSAPGTPGVSNNPEAATATTPKQQQQHDNYNTREERCSPYRGIDTARNSSYSQQQQQQQQYPPPIQFPTFSGFVQTRMCGIVTTLGE